MMPKIGDISSDWQLIARGKKDNSHYKYIYRCLACGDEATRYRASPPPLHACHRRFAPRDDAQDLCVKAWYHSDFNSVEAAQIANVPVRTLLSELSKAEIPSWPNAAKDYHYEFDDYSAIEE